MRFGPRNAYYLRISENTILPLYLYLDERHIDWMSERVLQHVLEDLRPRILPKLKEEENAHLGPGGPANAKRGSVDVYRGDTYQFGYFLRKTDPHAVLIKTRYFVPAPDPPKEVVPPRPSSSKSSAQKGEKRASKKANLPVNPPKRRKPKGKQKSRDVDEEDDVLSISSDGDDIEQPKLSAPMAPRRSARAKKAVAGGYQEEDDDDDMIAQGAAGVDSDRELAPPVQSPDAEFATSTTAPISDPLLVDTSLMMMDDSQAASTMPVKHEDPEPELPTLDIPSVAQDEFSSTGVQPIVQDEPEEDKTKLLLQLKYRGFNIHGRCLCVIVEPYPPMRSASVAPSRAVPTDFFTPRAPSIAPPDFVPSGSAAQRARTPLFLPEYDRERSVTPAPNFQHRSLPPVPLFNESVMDGDNDSDDGGMMDFSQLLRSVGQHQAGIVDDDDEIDGAVFFGDADENREL